MRFHKFTAAIVLGGACLTAASQPPPKGPATSTMNDLILRAARGEYPATAVLTGPLAERVKAITQSTEPIVGQAWRIGQIAQEGCWRVRFGMRQEKVRSAAGTLIPFEGGFDLNICEDGDAPLPR
mgnify:CR=1 FL=1